MTDVYSSTVPCSDCDERRSDLEASGHRVVDCREDPTLPGYCTLRYTRSPAQAARAPGIAASQAQAAKAIVNLFETSAAPCAATTAW